MLFFNLDWRIKQYLFIVNDNVRYIIISLYYYIPLINIKYLHLINKRHFYQFSFIGIQKLASWLLKLFRKMRWLFMKSHAC